MFLCRHIPSSAKYYIATSPVTGSVRTVQYHLLISGAVQIKMNIMRSVIEARRSPRPGGSGNGRGGGGGGGGGHVSVNTESWSFYGRSVTPTPLFLVGPVVGRVTETCAR